MSTDALWKALDDLAESQPKLKRGRVWCVQCGRVEKVDSGSCLRDGWPLCCGFTMSLDSPEERAQNKLN